MKYLHTESAPAAIGPYAQGVVVDGWLYTSGQVGFDPATGKLVSPDFAPQAERAFENVREILASGGCSMRDVVKANVFLTDLANFPRLNEIYAAAMGAHTPARTTIQVAGLPAGALFEIEVVARLPQI
jgi:2-iminobutanoate/2-iminopropanoate deaminase